MRRRFFVDEVRNGKAQIEGDEARHLTRVLRVEDPALLHRVSAMIGELEVAKLTYGDDLRIVFRHRPLREHPNALDAARVLAGLSRARGSLAFFDVLHRISRDEASLTAEHLQELLSAAGYGSSKLSELAAAGDSAVRADMQLDRASV